MYQSQMQLMVFKAYAQLGYTPDFVQAVHSDKEILIPAHLTDPLVRQWHWEFCTWQQFFPNEPFPGANSAYEDLLVVKARNDVLEDHLRDARREVDIMESQEARLRHDDRVVAAAACDYNTMVDALVDIGTMIPLVEGLQDEVKDMEEAKECMTSSKSMLLEEILDALKHKITKTFEMVDGGRHLEPHIENIARDDGIEAQKFKTEELEIEQIKASNITEIRKKDLEMAELKVINARQAAQIISLEEEVRKLESKVAIERNNKEQVKKSRDEQVKAANAEKAKINAEFRKKKPAGTAAASTSSPAPPSVIINGSIHARFNVNSHGTTLASGPPPRRHRPARAHAANFME
ncbi:hypothetical protein BDZ45DRAFT_694816 [Acephala macrosclerotiorum]|nr:hypothetical protein BDZ45DRAFT_694816 [Acephala macrosclerotiorum]